METQEKRIQNFVRDGLDRPEYLSPKVRIVRLAMDNVICASPLPGGNEDIGYDDWQ